MSGYASTVTDIRYAGDRPVAELTDGVVTKTYVSDASGAIVSFTIPAGQPEAGTYLVTWNGHGDALNLLRLNGDGTTTLANSYRYATWGAPTTSTHNGIGDLGFRYLYVGQAGVQWDAGIRAYLMGARHYSPALGRFLQPDPATAEDNLYGYATNSPITRLDPAGTESWSANWMERYLCGRYPAKCAVWLADSAFALAWAKPIASDWHENAIRHCVWQCLLTVHLGEGWATVMGSAHEEFSASLPTDRTVDYYNNAVGRALGKQMKRNWWMTVGAWAQYWATGLCTGAWNRGMLKTVVNGRIRLSSSSLP